MKELVDVLTSIDKRSIYQLMSNVQLPGSRTFDSHILMNYFTKKMMSVWINNPKIICLRMIVNMASLIRENTGEYPVKEKITYIEYHVQDNADVAHKDVKMHCDTNQSPTLRFCGSYPKPHVARGLGKHYNLLFLYKYRSWHM